MLIIGLVYRFYFSSSKEEKKMKLFLKYLHNFKSLYKQDWNYVVSISMWTSFLIDPILS